MKTVRRPPYPKWNPGYFPCSSLIPLPLSSRRPSVSFGGFGITYTVMPCRGRLARPVIPQHEYLIPVEVCGHIPTDTAARYKLLIPS